MSTSIRILARSVAALFFLVGAGGSASLFGQIVANPTSLNYGNVPLGLSTAHGLVLTNQGTSSVQVESMTFPFPSEYGIADGVFPITLNANGGNTTYSIVFRPAQAMSYNGNITVNFDHGNPLTIPVTGGGAALLGKASLSLTSIPYGNVALGTTMSQQVTITNVGTAAFSVTQIIAYAPFSIIGFSNSSKVTIEPGKSLTFSIGFSPFNLGGVNSTVTIFYDSFAAQGVDITGTGVAPASLAIASYPTLPAGTQTFPYTATLQATGGKTPYTWQITSGKVQGLSFAPSTGTFSGSVAGTVKTGLYNITVQVKDSSTPAKKATTTITVPVGAPTKANCDITSIDVTGTQTPVLAINDLGTGTYEGEEGGLYPNGSNVSPQQAGGESQALLIQPRDVNGNPSPSGIIGMIAIGESATQQPFSQFIPIANADPAKSPYVVLVNGALGGETAGRLVTANNGFINTILNYLLPFGGIGPGGVATPVAAKQVQVAWVDAIDSAQSGFPGDAQLLQGELESLAQILFTNFPNLKIAYFGSLNYTGYSQGVSTINPEPDAYETGFADKWAIQDQINGVTSLNWNPASGKVVAPWMGWGDYYWANGLLARTDGTYWSCQDLNKDGVHPIYPGGQLKIVESLLTFLKSDTTATPWFVVPAQ